jgi:hypothetical protein
MVFLFFCFFFFFFFASVSFFLLRLFVAPLPPSSSSSRHLRLAVNEHANFFFYSVVLHFFFACDCNDYFHDVFDCLFFTAASSQKPTVPPLEKLISVLRALGIDRTIETVTARLKQTAVRMILFIYAMYQFSVAYGCILSPDLIRLLH